MECGNNGKQVLSTLARDEELICQRSIVSRDESTVDKDRRL